MRSPAELNGTKAIVVGLGLSGCAAARFLIDHGVTVQGVDDKAQNLKNSPGILELLRDGLEIFSPDSHAIEKPDFIVVSPGVPPIHPIVQKAVAENWNLIGEVELAVRYLSNPIVGITGTNGKTTVTFLTTHVLQACGQPALALGNSGVPLTAFLAQRDKNNDSLLVVELSSYQLETLQTQCLSSAVLLNISPDHLERYGDMGSYAAAKMRIKACLKPEGTFFVERQCADQYAATGALSYGYSPDDHVHTDLKSVFIAGEWAFYLPEALCGRKSHDVENLMASYALCHRLGIRGDAFLDAYASFRKPSHRIELVRTHEGVCYINDSKGTNIDAVIKAVESLSGPIILIAGGVDKGAAYTSWIKNFAGKVRCIFVMGEAAQKITADVGNHIPVYACATLTEAVCAAWCVATAGETVLLSPGCASYDMFRDYVHRGDEFKRLVHAL